jgi:PAS domain S-box-containing protein
MLRKESYIFNDLVDIETFSSLLDSLFKATGIPNGLVSPTGEIITQSGWVDACAKFHRVDPDTSKLCKESNLELMEELRDSKVAGGQCKNGLYDYATPIIIEGEQLATLFLGQVHNAPPDLEFFRKHAKQYGFDEEAYIEAIRAAPIVSRQQMEAHLEYIVEMAQMLAVNGLAMLRENRLQQDLHTSTERRIQMEDLLEFSPIGISWCDAEGNIEYINRHFIEMFGYTQDDIPSLDTWVDKAYPDLEYREHVLDPWICQVDDNYQLGTPLPELESTITCKDGTIRRVVTRVSWVGEKKLANFTDITTRWKSEKRNRAQRSILEMIAKAEPLTDILNAISLEIELEEPEAYSSVLLLDDEGKHLFTGAAPRLPSFYNEAIDGIEIGVGVGSCGTAAKLGKRVIVQDIFNHEYWKPYVELAREAGVAACWSEPIIASDGKVLGTFAIYYDHPKSPNEEQIQLITFAANLASIAIENRSTREASLKKEREFRSLAENAPMNISRYDHTGRLIYTNQRLIDTFPNFVDQLMGKRFDEYPDAPFTDSFKNAFDYTIKTGHESSFETLVPNTNGNTETHL